MTIRPVVAATLSCLVLLPACAPAVSTTSAPTSGATSPGAATPANAPPSVPAASAATSASPSASAPAFPVSVEAANGEVTLTARPTRLVSLSPTATEMLFAIEAGEQVVAVDDQSDFPPSAPTTKLSGLEPNIEAIAGYEPDLVVISNDPGGLVSGLQALDVPVALLPAATRIEESYAQLEKLGALTGHVGDAAAVVARMQRQIEELSQPPPASDQLTYYHELDDTYYSVTSQTYIGDVYDRLGLTNIADAADKQGTGYPQLSAEYIIDADPDLIFLGDTECCGVTAEKVARRPGWESITAVRRGAIVPLDDDVTSRWGPRVVEFLRAAAAAVEAAKTGADAVP